LHDPRQNAALAMLFKPGLAALAPHLRYRDFRRGEMFWKARELDPAHVYFPLSGVLSAAQLVDGNRLVEIAVIGREAVAYSHSTTRGIALTDGTLAFLPLPEFTEMARRNVEIDDIEARSRQWLLQQSQQFAACNAVHKVDQRFCRWLLQMSDRLGDRTIPARQRDIADMLGLRRTTITQSAQNLASMQQISYQRARIRIRDRNRLQTCACSCYAALAPANWPFGQ
jgi:CRP-like cAMP-binding protein